MLHAREDLSLIVMMGVAGAGKTTVGRALAQEIGWVFLDADDFHPPGNRARLSAGIELTDADRTTWLRRLNGAVRRYVCRGLKVVLACSALKERYRAVLTVAVTGVRFVYLRATPDLCRTRLMTRLHFFSPILLTSQFITLEEPHDALVIDAGAPVSGIVSKICGALFA